MKKSNKEEFILKSIAINKDKYNYEKVVYINNKTKVTLVCNIHNHVFNIRPDCHISGQGCPECKKDTLSNLNKFTTEKFIKMCYQIHGDRYDYSKSNYTGTDNLIEIICKKHGSFYMRPHNHLGSQNCPTCSRLLIDESNRKNISDFILESNEVHNYKYDYTKVIYTNNKSKIIVICKKHGEFITTPSLHIQQRCGCTKCSLSLGEERICYYLDKMCIEYTHEQKFEGCIYKDSLYFDFYLPNKSMCIEYDGEHHFKSIKFNGGKETDLDSQILRDSIKNNYCISNNITLLRIPYYDYDNIEDILMKSIK